MVWKALVPVLRLCAEHSLPVVLAGFLVTRLYSAILQMSAALC
jgi:hypothetical protein